MILEAKPPLAARRKANWRIWAGFLVALAAFGTYFGIFVKFPLTRDVPWVTWLLFALAAWLFLIGVRRAWREPQVYRGKYAGPVLAVLSLVVAGIFGYFTLFASRGLPPSVAAPRVGAKAPDFTLADTNGKMVTLSALLTEPISGAAATKPRVVVLVRHDRCSRSAQVV